MTDLRWARLDELFHRLADVAPAERARILDDECDDDPSLRRELELLIAADDEGGADVADVVARAETELDGASGSAEGDRVGPYTLLGSIGQGGMGTVYLAERSDESYEARVAIKVLRGVGGAEWSARMRAERRILATLKHPGIARLIDGGETASGQPYLVMEHVEGEPLDAYCSEHALGVDERLRLFVHVCDAVQYAHGRLVVHRDLKPDNVLVDASGRPKLLDFGIAKLLGDDERRDVRTRTGVRPMTMRYASPEQIRGERVTTATDVHALGVILYELLTGALPHPAEAKSVRELEDAILERDADPPGVDPDLDTIVLKALAKDPTRRYDSVERLAEDVRRYLAGLPVLARPSTWTYRTGKFVRRNRGAVFGGVATLASIFFFGVDSGIRLLDMRQERLAAQVARDEAQAVTSFLVDVFEATDPNEAQGLDVTAREILGNARTRVRDEFRERPGVQGSVMIALGRAYVRLGAHDSATVLLAEAVARVEQAHGLGSEQHATALRQLGAAHRSAGDLRAAEDVYRRVLDLRLELFGPDGLDTGEGWNNLGVVQDDLGDDEAALASLLEGLRIRRLHLPDAHEMVVTTLGNVGSVLIDLGRHDEAIEYTRMALDGERALHAGAPHLDVAYALNNLASAIEYAGRLDEAEPLYMESLEIREQLLPAEHPSVLVIKNNLGNLYGKQGRPELAIEYFESILPERRRRGEPVPLAIVLNNYGVNLGRVGREAEGERAVAEAREIFRQAGVDR